MWPFKNKTLDLIRLAEADDPTGPFVSGRRLLEMVAELHRRGYQGLRIDPHMSPSGFDWRCFVLPKSHLNPDGPGGDPGQSSGLEHLPGQTQDSTERLPSFSTGAYWEPFGWKSCGHQSAQVWADRFEKEFPGHAASGRHADQSYCDWFKQMLKKTGPLGLVVARDDYRVYDPWKIFEPGQSSRTHPLPP